MVPFWGCLLTAMGREHRWNCRYKGKEAAFCSNVRPDLLSDKAAPRQQIRVPSATSGFEAQTDVVKWNALNFRGPSLTRADRHCECQRPRRNNFTCTELWIEWIVRQ